MADLDELFPYRTPKMVKILDRKLGFLFHTINLLVIVYIAVFVFFLNKGYLGTELALGQVKIFLHGHGIVKEDGTGDPIVFDRHDMRDPSLESGAVFVITKIDAVKQTRGECANPDFKCSSDSDCPLFAGISSQSCRDGLCVMGGWCPPIGGSETKVWQLDHQASNVSLWFRTAIQFPNLEPGKVFTNMGNTEPVMSADKGETDTWEIREILSIVGADLKDVADTGAMINARLWWDCDISKNVGCEFPNIFAKRLDSGSGYGFSKAHPIRHPSLQPGRDARFLYHYRGVRVLVSSKGEGKKFSVMQTVLQLSSALALLGVSKTVTDALMKSVLPEKRHYRQYKEDVTPDFSDVRDKIAEASAQDAQRKAHVRDAML